MVASQGSTSHRIASASHGMMVSTLSSGLPIQATWMPNSAQLHLCSPITYIIHAILRGQWQPEPGPEPCNARYT